MIDHDLYWMRRALALAAEGRGQTRPNPCVGAVIVSRDGALLGEGFHHRAGGPHAEIEALRNAARRGHPVAGATMYVTLEPCNHEGRTPPCSAAIIAAGIRRVVVGAADPNPVAGGGAARLRAAGVEVSMGVLTVESRLLNPGFMTFHLLGRPLVTVKWAATLDGCTSMAGGESKWITGEVARREVHRRRALSDALLVGVGTVAADDPALTIRGVEAHPGPPLRRIVIDPHLRTPPTARLLADAPGHAPPLLLCGGAAPEDRAARLRDAGAALAVIPDEGGRMDLAAALKRLASLGVQSLVVEGGRRTAGTFFDAGLVDRVEAWTAPLLAGGSTSQPLGPLASPHPLAAMAHARRLHSVETRRFGNDSLLEGWLATHLHESVTGNCDGCQTDRA